jgi:pilus assembly protein CpaE
MAAEVLILWPGSPAGDQLHDALLRAGRGLSARLLASYPDRERLAELLASERAVGAVVVGLSYPERALQVLRDALAQRPEIVAVAAHTDESADLMRAAMRAGASDYLTPPFTPSDIERAFSAVVETPGAASSAGRLIAVAPCQGTDGASTVAASLAENIAELTNSPSLLLDCDIQCSVTAFRLGLDPRYTLADALANAEALPELLPKMVLRSGQFDVLAAPDIPLGLMGEHLERLGRVLAAARSRYRYVVADLPPGLYTACLEVLLSADEIYLVCTPEIVSLHLARRRLNELSDSGVPPARIRPIVNRQGSRTGVTAQDTQRALGTPVFETLANDYAAVSQATFHGSLVKRETQLGRDLLRFAGKCVGDAAGVVQPPPARPAGLRRLFGLG